MSEIFFDNFNIHNIKELSNITVIKKLFMKKTGRIYDLKLFRFKRLLIRFTIKDLFFGP